MHIKDWKKEVFTIPNLLSLFRLALIPVYAHIYLGATERRQFLIAGLILAISCLTDLIDGKIARKFNMISDFGKALDPVADKLTQILKYNDIRSVTVTRMTVPCCGGLSHAVQRAVESCGKNIPLNIVTISPEGQIVR